MPTVCKSFQDEDSALREVEALIARGVPGADVRVLRGNAPARCPRGPAR